MRHIAFLKCQVCKKEFEVPFCQQSFRKFCGRKCYIKYRLKNHPYFISYGFNALLLLSPLDHSDPCPDDKFLALKSWL